VLEFEKLCGLNLNEFSKMITGGGKVDRKKLIELNPDLGEMIDLFQKLADIKNGK
jgi:hypothetical protein